MYTTRRNFIKQSIGAGAMILGSAFVSRSQGVLKEKVLDKKLGIALIGLGYYSTEILAPALQETKNVYLAGIVSGAMDNEQYWLEKYNIPRRNVYNYENFDSIADNKDIDIIYVVLPNSMHKEYTIRAARAGKHVLCEKPMAVYAADCEEMIKACKDNNVRLSIGYRMQFEPHTQEVMRYGREKVFGDIKYVTASAGFINQSPKTHWKLQKAYGGGVLMDMGVYSIQGARYTIGEEPVSVTAQQYKTDPERYSEVDEIVTMQLTFPGGAIANLMTSFNVSTNMLYAAAERGWFDMNPFSSYRGIKLRTNNGPVELADINQQARQMDEVAWCIVNNLPMRVPGEEGLRDLKVVEAARKALASGKKENII
ncbi:Gfo/Idh/MocA family oxidoreductase [candidate division KSB1 bacterium]|nr:Gfo/Idh/MocA family oxidoreductase [candidate division KSB1 bacterium]